MKTFLEWLGKQVYYHGASPENRESIRVHGLRASNPAEDDPDLHDEGEERRGVWVAEDMEDAMEWGEDVWEVETATVKLGKNVKNFVGTSHTYLRDHDQVETGGTR
jgi:hypothetical protein